MSENGFDELTKALATPGSGLTRRQVLRYLGGGMAGMALAVLGPRRAWADPGGNSACAQFCAMVFGADTPGAGACTSDAAHGEGMCYQCGPQAPLPAQAPLCGQVCCSTGQCCVNGACTPSCGGICCSAGQVCQAGQCVTPGACPNSPCPTPQMCNNRSDCVCAMTAEGKPTCWLNSTPCPSSGAVPCKRNMDCPGDQLCVVGCYGCVGSWCLPTVYLCPSSP